VFDKVSGCFTRVVRDFVLLRTIHPFFNLYQDLDNVVSMPLTCVVELKKMTGKRSTLEILNSVRTVEDVVIAVENCFAIKVFKSAPQKLFCDSHHCLSFYCHILG